MASRSRLFLAVAAAIAVPVAACSSGSKHTSSTRPPPASVTSTTTTTRAASTSSPSSGQTVTIPASIASNCSADVSAAIQHWIASVPDGSTLAFRAGACYLANDTITVENRHRLVLEGNGATLRAMTTGDRTRQQLVLEGGSDLTVRNLVVRGANPAAGATKAAYHADLEAQHAFEVVGATNVVLDHVQAYDPYGDFVYIGPENKQPSRNVTVEGSTFKRSGRQGISITDAVGVLIQSNSIAGAARSLFDIEPNVPTQVTRDIRIIRNTTGPAKNFWLADKGAPADIGDITISGNRMVAPTGGLIFVFARTPPIRGPYTIDHNQFIANDAVGDEGSKGAFFFARASNVTITANVVRFPPGKAMPAVELRACQHVRVTGNTFTDAGPMFLATDGSSDYSSS